MYTNIIDTMSNSKIGLRSRLAKIEAIAMIIVVLCIFALSCGYATASSSIEDVIVRFIVNATPVLFPPTRVSLQLCIDYGKRLLSSLQIVKK